MNIEKQAKLVDNIGYITGRIDVASDQEGPVMVLLFWDEDGIAVLQRRAIASDKGEYKFDAIPGKYYIAAFIDVNNDGKYQPEEHGNYYGAPTTISVGIRNSVTVETITISGPVPKPAKEIELIDKTLAAWKNIGQVVALDDPRFTLENYSMGLWKPIDLLEQAEGGLFFLEEYQEDKIPILFIHGVVNGPTLWTDVIENLDREHFQPWLFYYPSGLRLDMISNYLVEAVFQLQDKNNFKEFYVIAHSMGGLVARSFVKKNDALAPKNSKQLRMVMTVNSPMGEMAAAGAGVRHSPILVPTWRDVEPGSEFLQNLHDWKWPEEIPYHLVISYLDGKSGDGFVPLQSQAQMKLQFEATRIYVFNNEHTGTINDKEFLATLK